MLIKRQATLRCSRVLQAVEGLLRAKDFQSFVLISFSHFIDENNDDIVIFFFFS